MKHDQPVPDYKLTVSTKQSSPAKLQVGAVNEVHNVVTTSSHGSTIMENLGASQSLITRTRVLLM